MAASNISTGMENIKKSDFNNAKKIGTDYTYKHEIIWKNVLVLLILHSIALWGIIRLLQGKILFSTFIFAMTFGYFCNEGVMIGAHRCFTHKTFKPNALLKALLIIFQTAAGQNCVFVWCFNHRLHHRFADTDADPHNSKRGFFFSHLGWVMTKFHPLVIEYGKKIEMSDLQADWMIMFQMKYFYYLYFVFAFIVPVSIPVYFFNETWLNSVLFSYFTRYVLVLNGTFFINSAAHLYGTRPYKKNLQPVENWFVSLITAGEGWHNYHHAFPWDYKAAELGMHFNHSATIIEFFEKIGWAHDLTTASSEMVKNRILNSGDGTHYALGNDEDRAKVTAFGPVHPLNPSYNVVYDAPPATLKEEGLPLYSEKDVLKSK